VIVNQKAKMGKQALATARQPTVPSTLTTISQAKVHLYSTLEVKQTTTVNVSGDMLMSEVLEICCRKRKIDSNDYTLKMADTKTDIPLDKTLDSLGLAELCLLKKDRGPSGRHLATHHNESLICSR
jgi:hypothetical protein